MKTEKYISKSGNIYYRYPSKPKKKKPRKKSITKIEKIESEIKNSIKVYNNLNDALIDIYK